MSNLKIICCYLGWIALCSSSAFALTTSSQYETSRDIEFSAAAGLSWFHANNNSLIVSPYETDSLQVRNLSNSMAWKLGVGSYFFQNKLKQHKFLNALLMELNFYHSGATINGDVWQYEMMMFNNYQFRAPSTSNRLMLDVKPTLFTFHQLSPYFILGLGASFNTLSYNETVTGAGIDSRSNNILGAATKAYLAYDLGVGAKVDINTHLNVTLEYIYANLGHFTPNAVSKTGTMLLKPPTYLVYNQALLFGLSWRI